VIDEEKKREEKRKEEIDEREWIKRIPLPK
jgi:hypothetical protein